MNSVIERVNNKLKESNLNFIRKPLIIGGNAMEYYGMRKAGADIDLVICEQDYQALSESYPEKCKDLYGDLGVVINEFEIWRSIALMDYDFYKYDAIVEGNLLIASVNRMLFMRVIAMELKKYRDDLELIKNYYYKNNTNINFLSNADTHKVSYDKFGGAVFGGNYEDNLENG